MFIIVAEGDYGGSIKKLLTLCFQMVGAWFTATPMVSYHMAYKMDVKSLTRAMILSRSSMHPR